MLFHKKGKQPLWKHAKELTGSVVIAADWINEKKVGKKMYFL